MEQTKRSRLQMLRKETIDAITVIIKRNGCRRPDFSDCSGTPVVLSDPLEENNTFTMDDICVNGDSFDVDASSCCMNTSLKAEDLGTDTLVNILDFLEENENTIWQTDDEPDEDKRTVSVCSLSVNPDDEAVPVDVTVSCRPGIGIHLIGLPDERVKESLLRVVTALTGKGYSIPGCQIVITVRARNGQQVSGTQFDLPIAVGILAASGQKPACLHSLPNYIIIGELSLDGKVRTTGIERTALRYGGKLIIPKESLSNELESMQQKELFPAGDLDSVFGFLENPEDIKTPSCPLPD